MHLNCLHDTWKTDLTPAEKKNVSMKMLWLIKEAELAALYQSLSLSHTYTLIWPQTSTLLDIIDKYQLIC